MKRFEKKQKYKDFIQSENLTLTSYSALSLFSDNVRKMNILIKNEAKLATDISEEKGQKWSMIGFSISLSFQINQ